MQFSTINCFADIAPAGTRKPAVAIKKSGMARRKSKDMKCCMNEDTEPL